ncbi:MAG: GNAT family N-acetyltransferase [Campylobacterales bacterium]|nr:GNAT family N-acetyltransferase [Campylobacterales bacterium]
MKIRKALIDDAKEVYALEREAFANDSSCLSLSSIRYHIKKNVLYVVQIDDAIVAYALFLKRKKGYRLYSLTTKKGFQKRGIAKKLLTFFIDTFDFKYITLEVKTTNKKAFILYEALGFKEKKILKDFYDDCDGVLMELQKLPI